MRKTRKTQKLSIVFLKKRESASNEREFVQKLSKLGPAKGTAAKRKDKIKMGQTYLCEALDHIRLIFPFKTVKFIESRIGSSTMQDRNREEIELIIGKSKMYCLNSFVEYQRSKIDKNLPRALEPK